MKLLKAFPKVPKIENFCCLFDLVTGVINFSYGLIALWAIYFLQALIQGIAGTGKGKPRLLVVTLSLRWFDLGDYLVWFEHPLLPWGRLWHQKVNKELPVTCSFYQVGNIIIRS